MGQGRRRREAQANARTDERSVDVRLDGKLDGALKDRVADLHRRGVGGMARLLQGKHTLAVVFPGRAAAAASEVSCLGAATSKRSFHDVQRYRRVMTCHRVGQSRQK